MICLFAGSIMAQQEAQYTNFMFNKLPLNPGYAGSKEVACISALHRSQWVGIDGAPTTQTLNFHTPLFNQRVGLGLGILHDKLGLTNNWRGNITYSYRPKIGKGHLGIGVTGSVISHGYDGHNADTNIPNDVGVHYNDVSRYYPNFGAGLYYNTNTLYAGISIPSLLKQEIDYSEEGIEDSNYYSYKDRRHLYIMAGGLLTINDKIKFKPAALIKYVGGSNADDRNIAAPFDMDLNAMFLFMDALGVGGTWRMGDSFDALVYFQAAEQFRIGLGYDYSLTFRNRNKKLLNPRFFF